VETREKELYLHKIDPSNFIFYSVGFVAKDKDWDTDIVEVFPVEKIPEEGPDLQEETDLTDSAPIVKKGTLKDEVKDELIVLKKSATIRAKWLSLGQYNRLTPPDVRKGEQVLIYRYGNSDLFFWTTTFNDLSLRKEEIVRFVFSDKPQLDPEETLEDTYYFEINTKDKILKFHTTDKWKEYTTYDVMLDTKNGKLILNDGKGNSITLDSTLDMLNIYTNLVCTITTGATVTVTSPTVNVLGGGVVNVAAPTINANGETINIKGKTVNIKGGRVNIN